MGVIADAFEKQIKEYDKDKIFILKPVMVNGELRKTHTTDSRILNLLSFRGTGEIKSFTEIQIEFINYCDWWMNTLFETGNRATKDNPWLDSWVILKNYQVLYEVGDITLNKRSNRGVSKTLL